MYKRVNELLGTEFKSDKDVNWWHISSSFNLSEPFIREFEDKVNWDWISSRQTFSESFIREFKDRVNWSRISIYQTLSESFIREFKDYVRWENISLYQVLSESFIREFKNRVNWECISRYQILSRNFILEFEDIVDWKLISEFQPFIDSNYEKVDKELLNENISYNTYQKTKNRGWFVGYVIRENSEHFNYTSENFPKPKYKVKIYWKDLKTIRRTGKFNIIREVKYV